MLERSQVFRAALVALLLTPLAAASDLTPAQVRTENRLLEQAARNVEQFRMGDVRITLRSADGEPLAGAAVQVRQRRHEFLFGCIAFDLVWDRRPPHPERWKERFTELFNLAVFPFYWPTYEPRQGMPEWARMSEALEWCLAEGITPKGHPLVWACRSGVPRWLEGLPVERTEELSEARVRNIVRGLSGEIDLWDVVNEAVNVRSWRHKIEAFDDENDWGVEDEIPPIADYVEQAFRWAHEANPAATLILNEYNTIARPPVRERFVSLVRELQSRGVPVSGLGIQAHEPREEWYPPEAVWETLETLAATGLPLHATELHPQSSGKPITGGWQTGTWTEEAQADFTEQLVRLLFGHPAVVSINWWGLSDRTSWLPGGGLLDEEDRPKPVYERLRHLIREEWSTGFDSRTDASGVLSFRAFFGDYDVVVTLPSGQVEVLPVSVRSNEENHWTFTLGD
jgi:GH35 family endo-1,4-beta-xylanase